MRKIVILITSLVGRVALVALALQFKLDVFSVAAQVMGLPNVNVTEVGQIFAGLVLSSGAGGAHELNKDLQGL